MLQKGRQNEAPGVSQIAFFQKTADLHETSLFTMYKPHRPGSGASRNRCFFGSLSRCLSGPPFLTFLGGLWAPRCPKAAPKASERDPKIAPKSIENRRWGRPGAAVLVFRVSG